jgi:hypothetical protein
MMVSRRSTFVVGIGGFKVISGLSSAKSCSYLSLVVDVGEGVRDCLTWHPQSGCAVDFAGVGTGLGTAAKVLSAL